MPKPIYIIGIESSCDDTSIAIFKNDVVLSNVTANQSVHEAYGGVVPELASRAHQANILPTVDIALKQAKINLKDLSAVAFTKGPGLLGSLHVGTSFAKGLSMGLGIPLIGIDHMQGHVLAHFIQKDISKKATPPFPFLCLTVSGGHSQIMLIENYFSMRIIGKTLDDAAGEAFDKIAKMLGLSYPGGPIIDKLAKEGNANAFPFTESSIPDYNYSFSGIKTGVLYFLKKQNPSFIETHKNDICASAQKTIVNMLLKKLKKAAKEFNIQHIALAGGVSANSYLRNELESLSIKYKWKTYIPDFEFCTDNGAMIGIAGYYKYLQKEFDTLGIMPASRLS